MPTRFTSRSEVCNLFTNHGVNLRVDNLPNCQETLNFYIDDATETIRAYAGQVYSTADLNTSRWTRIRATWMTCYLLSQLGGNPSLFYGRYETIMEELKQVRDGTLPIPDLATSSDLVPSMSNINHDPRYFDTTRRVDVGTSTPNTGGTRPRDLSDTPFVSLF